VISTAAAIQTPQLSQRLALRQRPDFAAVGSQRWNQLLFLHWQVEPSAVQATLPQGLHVDTFEGAAYVGIVPFFMERVRPAWFLSLPWISWFLEMNVRTYVHNDAGEPGVWFYSLDCNQPIAVIVARHFFHLPYEHARMTAKRVDGRIHYQCRRRAAVDSFSRYSWSPGSDAAPAAPGTLDFFLIERYLLFSINRAGQFFRARVHHEPYQLHSPILHEFSSEPARWVGFDLSGAPLSVRGALGVDVSIHPLKV
jgi:uncharacterized protein YqjF (DUF2071 family)